MEQKESTTTDSTTQRARSPELVRPVQGRILAGVARGIADNFGISEWIPRIFFIVTAFMGGLGLALYAAGWVFIRSEDEAESPGDRFFAGASSSRAWVGIAMMVVAGIIVVSGFTFVAPEVVWALAFLVVGLLLYLGYIPTGASGSGDETVVESKEGVQRMTTTDTLETQETHTSAGDSPAGGAAPPPPTPTPIPPSRPPGKPRETSILGRLTFGIMLLSLGVLAVLDNIETLPIDAEPRHYMALAVTVLGGGLLVGSIAGRARWLIIVGAVMVPTLMFSQVFEYDWEASFDRHVNPTTFEQVASTYHIDVGAMVIDLTDLPWRGEDVFIEARVDAGNLEIRIPEGVGLNGNASVDIGRVSEPGRTSAGLGDPTLSWDESGELGTVHLDAQVNVGNIRIER